MSDSLAWQPSANISILQDRASLIRAIRYFFYSKNFLEVETPCMGQYGVTDRYLKNIEASCNGQIHYLQTSPEFYMKRLLASGSGPIFQLSKAFRDEEKGRWHQPEFTMLEFYQLDIDHIQLIAMVSDLFEEVCQWQPIEIITYQSLFERYCELNPHRTSIDELSLCLEQHNLQNVLSENEQDVDQYLFLLMAEVIEPKLVHYTMPIAVIDFPHTQSALARIKNNMAERFEVYYKGIELANGFHELTDVNEQKARFEHDNSLRQQDNDSVSEMDPYFLAALEYGLPSCSGVAIGIDRVVALWLKQNKISSVMSFAQP